MAYLTRYLQGNIKIEQSFVWRPFGFLVDVFRGVASRDEVDHFSQYRLEEWLYEGRFPISIVYDKVARTGDDGYSFGQARITVFRETDFCGLCDVIRNEIDMPNYGAPAFEMRFMRRRRSGSSIEIRRCTNASRL
ncbi:MAG: hypothetical protein HY516_03575 [Candidatus Aenigmarchaeota archaeon]|nr:hypothetical protein [Candidatus Aenigmarchaeota archaeon]